MNNELPISELQVLRCYQRNITGKEYVKVPCECSEEKQLAFMESLKKVLADLDEKMNVYYADGIHSTHNSRCMYAWIEKGKNFDRP